MVEVAVLGEFSDGLEQPQGICSPGAAWCFRSFPDPFLYVVPLGKALPFIAPTAMPSPIVEGNIVVMANPIAIASERLSGKEV
jgi:hypothetical protein